MRLLITIGARPNFIKAFPIIKELDNRGIDTVIVHTGQHYDYKMSQIFFDDLDIREPNYNLNVNHYSTSKQLGEIFNTFEDILNKEKPDIVIVIGDVNSTLACALTANKIGIPIAHIEAGLRCYDKSMQEEVNRVLTDYISYYLFASTNTAMDNIKKENLYFGYLVGNILIDALIEIISKSELLSKDVLGSNRLKYKDYGVLTLHRLCNVCDSNTLNNWLTVIDKLGYRIVMPCHPRTLSVIENNRFEYKNIKIIDPLSYTKFISLLMNSRFVISDSGGIQQETSYLNIPCYTLRKVTEFPETCNYGTNKLISSPEELGLAFDKHLNVSGHAPKIWDGYCAERIADIIGG